jgi:hypothetical protein
MIVMRLDEWHLFMESHQRVSEIDHFSDDLLRRIHAGFSRIAEESRGGDDLFEKFYRRRMNELCDHVCEAARTGQLRIDSNHQYMTDTVLSVFDAKNVNVFCETYVIDNEDDIFDIHSLNYFVKVLQRVDSGSIKNVRSLFVFDGKEPASQGMFMTLCALHHAKHQLEFKIIHPTLYGEARRDANIQHEFIDFGLYGHELMFRTATYAPNTAGFFSRNKPNIEQFQVFFDACWNSPAAFTTSYTGELDSITLLRNITEKVKDAYDRKVAKNARTSLGVPPVSGVKDGETA